MGLGGNAWHNKAFLAMKALATTFKKNSFDFALNVRLRTNIASHHGIEIALRMPLFANNIVDGDITGRLDYENTYNAVARYVFSF
ncbi:outer membrane beta-barrel protein [Helicobacter sp. 23-1046]